MSKTKIAITIDKSILARLDSLVAEQVFANRSQAIEAVVEEKIERLETGGLHGSVPSSTLPLKRR